MALFVFLAAPAGTGFVPADLAGLRRSVLMVMIVIAIFAMDMVMFLFREEHRLMTVQSQALVESDLDQFDFVFGQPPGEFLDPAVQLVNA